jgi:hypothetical protein
MSSSTPVEQALNSMVDLLRGFLPVILPPQPGDPPPPDPPPPAPSLSIVTVSEQAVGLSNRRGTEMRGAFPAVALKGVRLDALIRFQLWATEPGNADRLISELQARLQGASPDLRAAGFLKVGGEQTSLAEEIASLNAWRKTFDYRVLYEFHYRDDDEANSLIARIPIAINGEFNEFTLVTDEMVRWDKEDAPDLRIIGRRRPTRVRAVSILAFLPATWDGDKVSISVSMGGNVRDKKFATVREFVQSFTLEPETPGRPLVVLGGNKYVAGEIGFPNADFPDPVILGAGDVFEITYASPKFDSEAVVYLKVLH